jgi:hypothetical protein
MLHVTWKIMKGVISQFSLVIAFSLLCCLYLMILYLIIFMNSRSLVVRISSELHSLNSVSF